MEIDINTYTGKTWCPDCGTEQPVATDGVCPQCGYDGCDGWDTEVIKEKQ